MRSTATRRLVIRAAVIGSAVLVAVATALALVDGTVPGVVVMAVAAAAMAVVVVAGALPVLHRTDRDIEGMARTLDRAAAGRAEGGPPGGDPGMAPLAEALDRLLAAVRARVDDARQGRGELEEILASLQEGIVVVAADGTVPYANPRADTILGGRPRHVRSIHPPGLRPLVEEVRATGRPASRDVETGLPVRSLDATAVPLAVPGNVLVVLRDVTEARRVEAMRRDFVADASHELKTPAAAIRAAAETIRRAVTDDPAAVPRFAQRIQRDAERLSRILSDLLDLSRLEAERPALRDVRLDRLVGEQVDALRGTAADAGIALELRDVPVTVRGSARDLSLLVANLLDNALRYTAAGGKVTVAVERRDGGALVRVGDTGVGIPSREQPRVFERFYRVDRGRSRETGGTGLGLSIARHVAQQHGGRIELDSELGRGSEFRVVLPHAAADPDRPTVLFVCVHNAGRSQMAAALLERLAGGRVRVRSAGTEPADAIHPGVMEVMREEGIDLGDRRPAAMEDRDVREADVVVTMGCGDRCPSYPGKRYEDWDLPDPAGKPLDEVRAIREQIRRRVERLAATLL